MAHLNSNFLLFYLKLFGKLLSFNKSFVHDKMKCKMFYLNIAIIYNNIG